MELDVIKEVVSNVMHIDKSIITETSRFKEDLKCDSIELLQILMALEEKYNKKIDNDKLLNIKTVSDAINEIKNLNK